MKTKQEIERFWKVHDRIGGYHSSKKQIVPRPSAKVPIQKEIVMVERIHSSKSINTTTEKSMNYTFVGGTPAIGKQTVVDEWLS